jgi:hypothetical protein
VSTVLAVVATVVALLLAALGLVSTAARRRIGTVHLAGTVVLEAVLLVQVVLAVAGLAGGHRPPETAAFVGYLIGVVLVPAAGALWARSERTRWAGTVLAVAALVVAVMEWRLVQLWNASGA